MRKNATKIAAMALTLALTVTSVTLPSNTASAAKKTGLNKTKATLYVGGYAKQTKKNTTTLQLTVNGKKKKATFTSSKKSVATVNKNGKVTAKKNGKATITAKYNKKSYKCAITVKKFVNAKTVKITAPKNSKATIKVGEITWIDPKIGPNNATVKTVTYKSSNANIAKVGSRGKVRGKKAGTATITVTAQGGPKTVKATVKITVKNATTPSQAPSSAPSTTPSQAPSGAPSDAPSQAPSGAPSDAPSQAPSGAPSETPSGAPSETPSVAPGELSEITDLTVTKADELTAVFGAAVPEDVEMSVANGEKALEGEWKWSEDRKTATFTCKGALPTKTTVTVTATLGDKKVSKDVDVKEREVTKIEIKNNAEDKPALTGKTNEDDKVQSEAYIYYDVYDQYNESMRESETIQWTVSPGDVEDNKSLGKLTIKYGEGFTYGDQIYLTGVYAKNGTSETRVVKVGMPQEVNRVEFKGFVNKNDLTEIIPWENLSADFAANTYWLLYKSFDQSDNELEMDASEENRGKNLSFLSSDTTLIQNPKKLDPDDPVTVLGEQYGCVQIEPGMYVDRGGEVTITAISNKTGQKTERVLTLGKGGQLQSLELQQPTDRVTNGETIEIPYKATDIEGNEITDYETIARSSHELKLTAADGTLKLYEKNDGTAGVEWKDKEQPLSVSTEAGQKDTNNWYNDSSATDTGGRSVALTSVVVGGKSTNLMLRVDNTRRPDSITAVKVNDANSGYLASGTDLDIKLEDMTFHDQYGSELEADTVKEFFEKTGKHPFGDTDYYYGIKLDVGGNATQAALIVDQSNSSKKITDQIQTLCTDEAKINFTGTAKNKQNNTDTVETESVKYSIVRSKTQPTDAMIVENEKESKWDIVGKSFSATYSVLPIKMVRNPDIQDPPSKIQLTNQSTADNSSAWNNGNPTVDTLSNKASVRSTDYVTVVGKYNGKNVIIPKRYWFTATGSDLYLDDENYEVSSELKGQISGVTGNALKWSELYDLNTKSSKEVTKTLRIAVNTGNGDPSVIKSDILLSDADSYPTTIQYYEDGKVTSKATFKPEKTVIALSNKLKDNNDKSSGVVFNPTSKTEKVSDHYYGIVILDQYGNIMDPDDKFDNDKDLEIEYKVFDIAENTNSLAHKDNNCVVESNGTSKVKVEGTEIGDTFKLQLSVRYTNMSTVVNVTVGADTWANISSAAENTQPDETLRKDCLGYNR